MLPLHDLGNSPSCTGKLFETCTIKLSFAGKTWQSRPDSGLGLRRPRGVPSFGLQAEAEERAAEEARRKPQTPKRLREPKSQIKFADARRVRRSCLGRLCGGAWKRLGGLGGFSCTGLKEARTRHSTGTKRRRTRRVKAVRVAMNAACHIFWQDQAEARADVSRSGMWMQGDLSNGVPFLVEFIFCACGIIFLAWGGLVGFCASAFPHFRARAVIVCFRAFAFPLVGLLPVFASRFPSVFASAFAFLLLCFSALLLCLSAALL